MGKTSRFQKPEVERIQLSDGEDWIEIKKDLNTGDQKKLEAAGLKPPTVVDGKIISPVDWETYEVLRAAIFLTAWSFTDLEDRPTKPTPATLCALTTESFEEVNHTIFNFVMNRAKEKAAAKEAAEKAAGELKGVGMAAAAAASSPQSEPSSDATSSS